MLNGVYIIVIIKSYVIAVKHIFISLLSNYSKLWIPPISKLFGYGLIKIIILL